MSTRAGWSIPSPVKFGTSGWRGVIAEDFTFANVRLALTAIAEHVKAESAEPTILVAYDTRFYSEEFSQLAVDILEHHGVRALLCETFTPTPAVAYEIMRRKLDGAVNFTASHNPRSEEHTSELQSRGHLVCRLLLEKKNGARTRRRRPDTRARTWW